MELYIVNFYDHNESGNVEHTEMYSTWKAAKRRFNKLKNKLNCYSWVTCWSTYSIFGRIRYNKCLCRCDSCNGRDDYYHGDDSDF